MNSQGTNSQFSKSFGSLVNMPDPFIMPEFSCGHILGFLANGK
jgi:hypothetical protein